MQHITVYFCNPVFCTDVVVPADLTANVACVHLGIGFSDGSVAVFCCSSSKTRTGVCGQRHLHIQVRGFVVLMCFMAGADTQGKAQ